VTSAEHLQRAARLLAQRSPFVSATVVRARRPTSAHPGDSALVLGDGTVEGFVGGACALASVRSHALRALQTGQPLLLRILPQAEADTDAAVNADSGDTESGDAESDDATVATERNPCLSGGSLEILLTPRLPAPLVAVAGDGPIAQALVAVAQAAGFATAPIGEDQPPDDVAAVVVASHGAKEEPVLAAALLSGVPYVALVASRTRGESLRDALEVPAALRARLRTPAGLAIGARTPGEIAVSILAEMIATLHETASPAPPHTAAGHSCCEHHGG
jgi:xanthine dehydrogenase accessory factor